MRPHPTKAMPSTKTWWVYHKDTLRLSDDHSGFYKRVYNRKDEIKYGNSHTHIKLLIMVAETKSGKWHSKIATNEFVGGCFAVNWLLDDGKEYATADEAVKAVDECCEKYADTYEDIEIIEKVLDNLIIE